MNEIDTLIADHEKLVSWYNKLLETYPDSDCIRIIFHSKHRPWSGEKPTPAQAAADEWRCALREDMKRLREYFLDHERESQLKRYPLAFANAPNFGYSYNNETLLVHLEEQKSVLVRERQRIQEQPKPISQAAAESCRINWRKESWGQKLRSARKRKGHLRKQAAEYCGAPLGTYNKWEGPGGRSPSDSYLNAVRRYIESAPQ